LLSKLGSVTIFRTGFQIHGGGIYYPIDELLRIPEVKITNGLKGMIAYLGALHPLRTAEELLMMFMEIPASHNYCSKLVYEVGCDAEKIEIRNLKKNTETQSYIAYQADGGRVRTREDICLGKLSKKVFRILDLCLTGSIEEIKISDEGKQKYSRELNPWVESKTTLITNGIDLVQNTVVDKNWEVTMDDFAKEIKSKGHNTSRCNQALISDGATHIQDCFAKNFPNTEQILDEFHFSEHLNLSARLVFSDNELERKQWVKSCKGLAFANNSTALLEKISDTKNNQSGKEGKEALRLLYNYVNKNKERIRYGYFRDKGLPIGSGEVEATIKKMNDTKKIKRASTRWRKHRLSKTVALRSVVFNSQFNELATKIKKVA
jgi:hypothetical protein